MPRRKSELEDLQLLAVMNREWIEAWELCAKFLVCQELEEANADGLAWYRGLSMRERKLVNANAIPPVLAVLERVFSQHSRNFTVAVIERLPSMSRAVFLDLVAREQEQLPHWQAIGQSNLDLSPRTVDPSYVYSRQCLLWSLALESACKDTGAPW